jgi:hypothetical protein
MQTYILGLQKLTVLKAGVQIEQLCQRIQVQNLIIAQAGV